MGEKARSLPLGSGLTHVLYNLSEVLDLGSYEIFTKKLLTQVNEGHLSSSQAQQ